MRRSEMMLEDLVGCMHEPETPVCDDDGTEILYWICRCGQRCPETKSTSEMKPPPTAEERS